MTRQRGKRASRKGSPIHGTRVANPKTGERKGRKTRRKRGS